MSEYKLGDKIDKIHGQMVGKFFVSDTEDVSVNYWLYTEILSSSGESTSPFVSESGNTWRYAREAVLIEDKKRYKLSRAFSVRDDFDRAKVASLTHRYFYFSDSPYHSGHDSNLSACDKICEQTLRNEGRFRVLGGYALWGYVYLLEEVEPVKSEWWKRPYPFYIETKNGCGHTSIYQVIGRNDNCTEHMKVIYADKDCHQYNIIGSMVRSFSGYKNSKLIDWDSDERNPKNYKPDVTKGIEALEIFEQELQKYRDYCRDSDGECTNNCPWCEHSIDIEDSNNALETLRKFKNGE